LTSGKVDASSAKLSTPAATELQVSDTVPVAVTAEEPLALAPPATAMMIAIVATADFRHFMIHLLWLYKDVEELLSPAY
jgi:hypothetical protein